MTYFASTTHTTFAPLEGIETPMLMRRATEADAARIRVIARLDDKRLPSGPFLVAELSGEVVAALSLTSGTVVADPFRPTADAVAMLRLRRAQVSAVDELTVRRERGSASDRAPATIAA
jgi:hypothetical protein